MKKNTPEALIDLFEELKNLFETDTSLNNQNSSRLQEILTTATIRVRKASQTVELEARSVYQNIHTLCFVEKIHLNPEEANVFKEIEKIALSKGFWGGMNTLNVTNQFPSN
ncbi:bacteriocin immunity protein [Listeria monocytogenes]|uniref:Bacteriocin immunity protein n=1 Tax=Listeria monocytogenes TaxID=1639 RepID=A0A9P2FF06_LISMN|nr:bacteriocin immunity protein [Listeria monocytogenes]EAF4501991.1 bacteriocin immunity protein [Listeria monocytogenes serotype 4b]EAF4548350.1 bacteriocin immunity protein [Listeria monocytogenes serotype 1/2a]EHC6165245.1 bacteriocin immunity protein [Listeria monocytogenes serotype 1/2b]MCY61626.1 bacteriocin immunity protein [Listeria monocytogenes serotype 4c]EAC3746614.1 bacteriocin immunity protein [Listeria monocytogenes]